MSWRERKGYDRSDPAAGERARGSFVRARAGGHPPGRRRTTVFASQRDDRTCASSGATSRAPESACASAMLPSRPPPLPLLLQLLSLPLLLPPPQQQQPLISLPPAAPPLSPPPVFAPPLPMPPPRPRAHGASAASRARGGSTRSARTSFASSVKVGRATAYTSDGLKAWHARPRPSTMPHAAAAPPHAGARAAGGVQVFERCPLAAASSLSLASSLAVLL